MIITLTPNPSIDRTIGVPELQPGEVNRATPSRIDPGGKGVNVSRALSANGVDTVSYTHLDVYKRQRQHHPDHDDGSRDRR